MSAPVGPPRLLSGLGPDGAALSLAEHVDRHGPLPQAQRRRGPDDGLISLVESSGLRGRGGAGFPTARKLDAVAGSRRPVVVANGAEGEPESAKDRILLIRAPHLVLDGAQLAARAVGATEVVVAVPGEAEGLSDGVERAIAERRTARLDGVEPVIAVTPPGFLAGEESALMAFLNGRAAKPSFVPPRPYQRGVRGRPTLVQNVETLAHMALIARHGAEWFRALGTPAEPGSTLITLGGAVGRPGLYEIGRGAPMRELLAGAGGTTVACPAYLVGGYGGSWLPAEAALEAQLSDESLASIGGLVGSGVVVALPEQACGLRESARVLAYLAREGAGQCGPCVHGLASISGAMSSLARGEAGQASVGHLERWASQVSGRGACHHPDGAARLLTSTLHVFRADLASHVRRHRCSATGAPAVLRVPSERLAAASGSR